MRTYRNRLIWVKITFAAVVFGGPAILPVFGRRTFVRHVAEGVVSPLRVVACGDKLLAYTTTPLPVILSGKKHVGEGIAIRLLYSGLYVRGIFLTSQDQDRQDDTDTGEWFAGTV